MEALWAATGPDYCGNRDHWAWLLPRWPAGDGVPDAGSLENEGGKHRLHNWEAVSSTWWTDQGRRHPENTGHLWFFLPNLMNIDSFASSSRNDFYWAVCKNVKAVKPKHHFGFIYYWFEISSQTRALQVTQNVFCVTWSVWNGKWKTEPLNRAVPFQASLLSTIFMEMLAMKTSWSLLIWMITLLFWHFKLPIVSLMASRDEYDQCSDSFL